MTDNEHEILEDENNSGWNVFTTLALIIIILMALFSYSIKGCVAF